MSAISLYHVRKDRESLTREILNFMSLQLHMHIFIYAEIHFGTVLEETSLIFF